MMTFKVGIIVIPILQVRYLGLRNTKQLIQGYITSNNQNISNSTLAPGLLTTAAPCRWLWLPPGPAWTLLQRDGDHGLAIILITSTGTPEDGERAGLLWKEAKACTGWSTAHCGTWQIPLWCCQAETPGSSLTSCRDHPCPICAWWNCQGSQTLAHYLSQKHIPAGRKRRKTFSWFVFLWIWFTVQGQAEKQERQWESGTKYSLLSWPKH